MSSSRSSKERCRNEERRSEGRKRNGESRSTRPSRPAGEELRQIRKATFERILGNAPDSFSSAQLRMLLRALVNLDPYTFADDVAEEMAGGDENEKRTAEEVLLADRLAWGREADRLCPASRPYIARRHSA